MNTTRKLDEQLAKTGGASQKGKARRSGPRDGRGRHDVRVQSGRAANGEPDRRAFDPSNRVQHTHVHRIFHHVHFDHQ